MIAIDALFVLALIFGGGYAAGYFGAKGKSQGQIALLTQERDSAREQVQSLQTENTFAAKLLEDKKAQLELREQKGNRLNIDMG